MSANPAKQISKGLVWILLIFVLVGLGGYGVSNFGGSIDSIGTVGKTKISVDSYARALRQELRAQEAATGERLSLADAEAQGLVAGIRARVIAETALDNEVDRIGVSVGDERVAQEVLAIEAFQGPDGNFDRENYKFVLEQNGLTEAQFEAQIRTEAARALLQAAVVAGTRAPETFGETIFDFIAERRSASLIHLTADDLDAPLPDPTEAQIAAQYEATPEAYTAPRTRRITYAWLTPEMMLDRIEPDEDLLRQLYDERIDEFVQPERRLVERLVFSSEADAQAAKAAIDAGETTFDAAAEARGLTLADIDLGDVSKVDIGGAAGDTVFAPEGPGVVGPVMSDLGPALFRVNAILPAQETSFEEAREALKDDAARDRAVRMIADRITELDDMLAAGATLEELTAESELTLGQIGYNAESDGGIAAYADFRSAADTVTEDDFPEIMELEDGGIFALRLDEDIPPALRPLDAVRSEVVADWRASEIRSRLSAQAEALKARLEAGEAIDALGPEVERQEGLSRGGLTPAALSEALFNLPEPGATAIVSTGDSVWLIRLDAVLPPDEEDPSAPFLRETLASQAAQGIAQDIYTYFSQALIDTAGLSLDQAAINAVHAQFR